MRRALLVSLVMLVSAAAAPQAEEVVGALSQNRISITAGFDGSEILVFGAVKRMHRPREGVAPLEVVVTIEGPAAPVTIRRKERVAGLWVNVDGVTVRSAPSFYAAASSGPMDEVLSATEDLRHRITVPRAIRAMGVPGDILDAARFTEALIRIREREGRYAQLDGAVRMYEQTLFRTAVTLPANLPEGEYRTRIFLTRDGRIVDEFETAIDVGKVGLERWLFTLAHDQPLLYGLMSLALALAAGWGASVGFQWLRP